MGEKWYVKAAEDAGDRGSGPPPIPPGRGDRGGRRRREGGGGDDWGGGGGERGGGGGSAAGAAGWVGSLLMLAMLLGLGYGAYVWFIKRVVVPQDHVLVLLKKNGTRSLPGDQVVIPAPPNPETDPTGYERWTAEYRDVNGILEQVYQEGTYFSFSPFDFERTIHPIASVPGNKVGLLVRHFGAPLDEGQVLADEGRGQRGPMPGVLQPGTYPQFSNPWAYEIILVDPVVIEPGHRGVVTIMAGPRARNPNAFLVAEGEQGIQPTVEPEGRRFINLFERRVTPISMQSQRFQMAGSEAIRFPSSDSFEIRMEGFVEWSIIPERLPLIYAQYSEGSGLLELLEERVILPYSRSFSRLVGSRYLAREFISGDTRLKFQSEFEEKLREACLAQGIEVRQALVRDIIPPEEIKTPINEREVARQQIFTLEQQIRVATSQADLARQTELATQNQRIGDATREAVTVVKAAERDRDVAITQAREQLEVAKLQLDAARNQASALVARGEAEAAVVLLEKRAQAEPLSRQVQAFGGGEAFAQYFFFQRVAPSIQSILTNTEGPFAELFGGFMKSAPRTMSPVQPAASPVQPGAAGGGAGGGIRAEGER